MLANYVPRAYLDFFYTCSFVTSLRRCRQWMYVQIASARALLLSCMAFGSIGDDPERGPLPNSPQPVLCQLQRSGARAAARNQFLPVSVPPGVRAGRLAGVAGILLSTFYAFRTGSRGCVIAASAMLILIFSLSRSRWKVAALGLAALGIALVRPRIWRRILQHAASPVSSHRRCPLARLKPSNRTWPASPPSCSAKKLLQNQPAIHPEPSSVWSWARSVRHRGESGRGRAPASTFPGSAPTTPTRRSRANAASPP